MGYHAHGGAKAAKLLREAVVQYLSTFLSNLKHIRIVVQVYMNSEKMARIPFFTTGFSSEEMSFDFVNADNVEIVKKKIAGMCNFDFDGDAAKAKRG
jgi:hypothetical protein